MKSVIAFSLWNSQSKREPDVNDVFDIFGDVVEELYSRCDKKRQLIIIEDLDRITQKTIVVKFLKEIFRFNNLMSDKLKEKLVFLISVKPESELEIPEDSNSSILEKRDIDQNTKYVKGEKIYSKIFDFSINLNPIHNEDYEVVINKLINLENKENLINNGINIEGNMISKDFAWIIKGDNLTVRDLKERINNAVLLFKSLKNRDLKGVPDVDFGKCSAVSYLE